MSHLLKIHAKLFALACLLILTACSGGSGGVGGVVGGLISATLSGSVGDGPVIGATIVVKSSDGTVIGTVNSDNNANFNITVKAKGSDYPLLIEATGGTDLVTGLSPDFVMYSTTTSPSEKRVNINPFSTIIVKTALAMSGGFTESNVALAKNSVLTKLNFGLNTNLIPDPITTTITADNVAVIVKASETFGEMIRRTRDTVGVGITGDDVMNALAADLTDGAIDGSGMANTNAHISAATNIVSSQVIIEAMNNNLTVNGIRATDAMNYAIGISLPGAPSTAITENVRVTDAMLAQAGTSIQAAQAIAPSAALTTLLSTVEGISGDSLPADIPNLDSSDLDTAITTMTSATDLQISSVNSTAGTASNGAPVISGTPSTSVAEGNAYSFTPSASDEDGDALTFSISNKPVWASFNTSTGALTGTPWYARAGIYSNIVIGVSDGLVSTNLSSFSITVADTNRAPTISGTPATFVTEGSAYSFTPSASDEDGDALTFSISNKPVWASFNTSTGALTGTPDNGYVGTYSNIAITVSDGVAVDTTGSFTIIVSNQTIASARKYHPGHYVMLIPWVGNDHEVMIDSIKPNVVGVTKRYPWRDLEPSLGQYDFSEMDADLALLAGQGMQLIPLIEDRSFKVNERLTPSYLDDYTVLNNSNSYTAKRWDPYVVTRMKALMKALGDRYDAHPNFEGISIQESALGLSQEVSDANGYTPELYRDALIDVISSTAQSFPTSRVFWYMNYLQGHNSYIGDIASAVAPYEVVMGGPDVLPDSVSLQTHTYPFYDQFQGQMPLFIAMQNDSYDHVHQDTSFPTKYWTMDELFLYARDNLHVNYVFWNRVPNPSPSDSYDWTDAIPVIGNNPVVNP